MRSESDVSQYSESADAVSQYSGYADYADDDSHSDVSTQAPLTLEEKKLNNFLQSLIRYIYIGSNNYTQITGDLQIIKDILSNDRDLLKSEAEFITTKLSDQFQGTHTFDTDDIRSNLMALFTNIDNRDIEVSLSLLSMKIILPVIDEKNIVIEDDSASPCPQCCCGLFYNFFDICSQFSIMR